jgi:hypothetical protein
MSPQGDLRELRQPAPDLLGQRSRLGQRRRGGARLERCIILAAIAIIVYDNSLVRDHLSSTTSGPTEHADGLANTSGRAR